MAVSKNRVVLRSNFRAAAKAGDDAIAELIENATEEMEDAGLSALERGNQRHGYNISTEHLKSEHSDRDGRIWFDEFYGRFFEWGTLYIPAMPFIRPGHRAGRKYVKTKAPDIFQKWINRKARIR